MAVLITDSCDRVLLTRTPEDGMWSLPTGVMKRGETPYEAGVRTVHGQIGLVPRLGTVLVSEWVSDRTLHEERMLHLFDGGRTSPSAEDRVRAGDQGENRSFVPEKDMPSYLEDAELGRATAALRARSENAVVYLENGHAPPILSVMERFGIIPWLHSGSAWSWHEEPVPDRLPIQQAWVWLFTPDGRVVIYLDDKGQVGLPGGTLEDFEYRDPVAASIREVREEVQIDIVDPIHLGYMLDEKPGRPPFARVRAAAAVRTIEPSAPDPATGTIHRRLLVPAHLVDGLCGWGPEGEKQRRAATAAARRLGIEPSKTPAVVEEIPVDGIGVLPRPAQSH